LPNDATIAILTYHSISDADGPTSIPRDVFREQMALVAELDVKVASLDVVRRWLAGEEGLAGRTIAITFDDAFRDFEDAAHPILKKHGFAATVFVPTAIVGGAENWAGANNPARPLMDWSAIKRLSADNIDFGSHTRTHCDLTAIEPAMVEKELRASRQELEQAVGKPAPHFAPPYGSSNDAVRRAIAGVYDLSVGVRLGEARKDSPLFDLPRIEMHYFRDMARWRAFLSDGDALYMAARGFARNVRALIGGGVKGYLR
jgi:peptidoglycan/xylan/chitin deacetylase (PgdA/CDA1 family)